MKILAYDVETGGLDIYKGYCEPFYVSTCDENDDQVCFSWEVNPVTRKVLVNRKDIRQILGLIRQADLIVGHNIKFDVGATLSIIPDLEWPWEKTQDTLIASHLLSSNTPHNLTDLAMQYLGQDILPYEKALKKAVDQARKMVTKKHPEKEVFRTWRPAKKGMKELPSLSGSGIGCDYWMPRAVAIEMEYPLDHPWHMVLATYSDLDTAITIRLFKVMEEEIKRRELWAIYLERLKLLQVTHEMERRGVTISKSMKDELTKEYREESIKAESICVNIAKTYSYDLDMPDGANNNSLRFFVFGSDSLTCDNCGNEKTVCYKQGREIEVCPKCTLGNMQVSKTEKALGLPQISFSEKTGEPSLDAKVMEAYTTMLEPRSLGLKFVKTLKSKRSRDTACSYMDSYEKYWIESEFADWFVLHPSFNITGTRVTRLSSSSPNGQNISKKEDFNLRKCFGPAPGREWWSMDYENIELRLPAFESGESVMIELFEKPNDPPYFGSYHLMNASIIYPDIFWPIADKKGEFKERYKSTWYQWLKNFDFAYQYSGGRATCDAAAHKVGAYNLVKNRLKEHTRLNNHWVSYANRHGYVETIPDKSLNQTKGYPVMCTRGDFGGVVSTTPLSFRVQGSAGWAGAKAMTRCSPKLKEWTVADPRGYYMVLNVHDELVFDMPKGTGEKPWKTNYNKAMELKRLMEMSGHVDYSIPLTVSVSYHSSNWSEEQKV